MMEKIKGKKPVLNSIDLIVAAIVILLALVFILAINMKKPQTGKPVLLTVEITDSTQSELIYTQASKLGDIYLNSVNSPVKATKVSKNGDKLDIEVLGQGEIADGKYIFNSTRVLVGQKAEIHASYFAQGYIKDVKYAD